MRERASALGLAGPPWGPEAWAQIAPPQDFTADDPVKSDPAVIAATEQRDKARQDWDLVNDLWLQAVEVLSRAQLGQHDDGQGSVLVSNGRMWTRKTQAQYIAEARLAEEVRRADERRQVAWRRVVDAQQAIARAQHVARQRAAAVEMRAA